METSPLSTTFFHAKHYGATDILWTLKVTVWGMSHRVGLNSSPTVSGIPISLLYQLS